VVSGHPRESAPRPGTSSAAALLAFDVPHSIPWDWRVGLYTLTKGIAAGAYLVALLLTLTGTLPRAGAVFGWIAPLVALVALAATGGILVSDLEHPGRFWMLLARPQWRSWLVRGAWIITAYGLALTAHVALALTGRAEWLVPLGIVTAPLAVMTAVYTAWLFAQAKARDLWQSPLLPPHFFVQALLVGSAALAPVAWILEPDALDALLRVAGISALVHLLLVAGDVALPHATAHARLAVHEMTQGRFRSTFLGGVVLCFAGTFAPTLGAVASEWGVLAAVCALAGVLCHEHAHVQAGQSVPLA
jgi:formate-dependent nitrite reductase membrane component NrfD